jgi:NTP pyrophosphatase (non-canonical NTP hydrolase)
MNTTDKIAEIVRSMPCSAQVAGAVVALLTERQKQHAKWGEQNHDMMTWLAILHEETGELAEACLHHKFGGPEADNVLKEAVQVAAVGCQIVEYLLKKPMAWGEEAEAAQNAEVSDPTEEGSLH